MAFGTTVMVMRVNPGRTAAFCVCVCVFVVLFKRLRRALCV